MRIALIRNVNFCLKQNIPSVVAISVEPVFSVVTSMEPVIVKLADSVDL